jgi:hypothetical protein
LFQEDGVDREAPFVLLPELSLEEERKEFLTINTTQKGVSASLGALLGDTIESDVTWFLANDAESPFRERIAYNQQSKTTLFTYSAVCKAVKRTFAHALLDDFSIEDRAKACMQYWTCIADALPDEWMDIENLTSDPPVGRSGFEYKLLEATGLIAWSMIAPEIISRAYHEGVGINWDVVKQLVASVADLDWAKDGQYAGRTGEAGGRVIMHDLQRRLPPQGPLTEE